MSQEAIERPEDTGSGFGNRATNARWFNVNKGKFRYSELKRDEGGEVVKVGGRPVKVEKECDFIRGSLAGLRIRWNEGNAQVRGHYELMVSLTWENTKSRDSELYNLVCHFPSTWAWIFADFVANVPVGTMLGVSVWGIPGNDKVSNCKVERLVGSQLVALPRKGGAPKGTDADLAARVGNLQGKERQDAEEAYRKERSEALGAWARAIVEAHPAFIPEQVQGDDAADAGFVDEETGERVDARAEPQANATPSANGPHASLTALVLEAFSGIPGDDDARLEIRDAAPYEAFGYKLGPRLVVSDEQCVNPLSKVPRVESDLSAIMAEKGVQISDLWLGVRATMRAFGVSPDWIGSNADLTEGVSILAGALVRKVEQGNGWTMFTNAVAQERGIVGSEAREASGPVYQSSDPSAPHYDPFAD